MIQHIVLLKWQEGADADAIEAAIVALRRLEGVETASAFAAGEGFGRLAKGYQFGLVLRLSDRAALKAYWPHPLHEQALALVQPLAADVLVFDFEA
jgi:hypothetical protein